jgi:hypothetical protein
VSSDRRDVSIHPPSTAIIRARTTSFDHPVGAAERRQWNGEAERHGLRLWVPAFAGTNGVREPAALYVGKGAL